MRFYYFGPETQHVLLINLSTVALIIWLANCVHISVKSKAVSTYVCYLLKESIYVHIILDTHALVRFLEDERTGLVPVGRIEKKDTLEYNGSCKVKWSNGKKYQAFLLVSGTIC